MTGANGTPASAAGTITLGGELRVNRMGFGAMLLVVLSLFSLARIRTALSPGSARDLDVADVQGG